MVRRTAACSLMALVVAVGCTSNESAGGEAGTATTPAAAATDPSATSVLPGVAPVVSDGAGSSAISTTTTLPAAEQLADSQVSASTVVPPTVPGWCNPDRVGIVVDVADPSMGTDADQVIQIVNDNDVECEVDVSESPDAAADLEPSVRLQPVEAAQLWVSARERCGDVDLQPGDPQAQDAVEVRINGIVRVVPLAFTPPCGIELWAFFPN